MPPTDQVSFHRMSMLSDAFLFWSISAGGIDFKSAMPAFEKVLSENIRSQIITVCDNPEKIRADMKNLKPQKDLIKRCKVKR